MPIHQDKILNLLKAAKAYQQLARDMVNKLEANTRDIRNGTINLTAAEYNQDLWFHFSRELQHADMHNFVAVQLCDDYYTDAVIRRNENNKIAQRLHRAKSGVKPKGTTREITEPEPMPEDNYLEPETTPQAEEEMRRIMEQMGVKAKQ